MLKYIGNTEKMAKMLMQSDSLERLRIKGYEHGIVYCLYRIAKESGIVDILKKHFHLKRGMVWL